MYDSPPAPPPEQYRCKVTHQYHTVWDWDPNRVDKKVSAYLNDGWTCQGGVSISVQDNGNKYFAQALTKTTSTPLT